MKNVQAKRTKWTKLKLGTLRYCNADADVNVKAEERLGIEHCTCQLCHRLTSASRRQRQT